MATNFTSTILRHRLKLAAISIIGLLAFVIFGGFTRHNIGTALYDIAMNQPSFASYGKPYKPNIQEIVAHEFGYTKVFSGCAVGIGTHLGQYTYNGIMKIFMNVKRGNDWEKRERDLFNKLDSLENIIEQNLVSQGMSSRIFPGCSKGVFALELQKWNRDTIEYYAMSKCDDSSGSMLQAAIISESGDLNKIINVRYKKF